VVEWVVLHRAPKCQAGIANLSHLQMGLSKIPKILCPVEVQCLRFRCEGFARGTMFLHEPPPADQCPLRGDVPRGVMRIQTMVVKRVRMMENLVLLEQPNGQIDVFPEEQLVIVAAHGIETGFAKQRP